MSSFALPAPVLIVEDNSEMLHRTIRLLIETGYDPSQIICARTRQSALDVDIPIALAFVDIGLPDGSGIDVIKACRERAEDMLIVVISAWSTKETILSALSAGANGYLLKERDDMELLLSVRSVIRGGAPIDPFIAQKIINHLPEYLPEQQSSEDKECILTPREREILDLVAKGMSNREISEELFISRHTVECHIKRIYQKLSAGNRISAISTARSLGLLH